MFFRSFSVFFTMVFSGILGNSVQAIEHPNVIVIMTDDQGYGEFSCNGNPITRTPNIDALARAGVRLTDFHVAPMCTPTRGQLMSGLDAFRNNASNVSSGRTLLRADIPTIADVFRRAGYRTGLFGKWHLGDNYPYRPHDRGFDEAIWFPSSHIPSVPDFWDNDYFDDTYLHRDDREKFAGYCTDVFFEQATAWMTAEASTDQPFFAMITLNAAHWPWFVPDRFRIPIAEAMRANPDVVAHLNEQRKADLISFLAMGGSIDENVGKLDQALAASGLLENTIVVFLTDNGSTMGQDYFNAGMRGRKTQLWEGGHRVPCFIRWPAGDLGQPRDVPVLSHVQDLLPTLAELAKVSDFPDDLDGESLAPILRGETESIGDRMLVINYSRMPGMKVGYTTESPTIPQMNGSCVLWRNWRLLENRELYDVVSDPRQVNDIAEEHPDVVAKMRTYLETWWHGVEDQVMKPQRVIIGSDHENPMLLTACEWLDVFVDQQIQVRAGVRKNGVWHLKVDRPGTYRFELRRWPREAELKLTDGLPRTVVTDGDYPPGVSLPIADARIKIGDFDEIAKPDGQRRHVVFETELTAGPIEMQTWFRDATGQEICGAYYVDVHCLPEKVE